MKQYKGVSAEEYFKFRHDTLYKESYGDIVWDGFIYTLLIIFSPITLPFYLIGKIGKIIIKYFKQFKGSKDDI